MNYHNFSDIERKAYVNSLFLKSEVACIITSLIILNQNQKIKEIHADFNLDPFTSLIGDTAYYSTSRKLQKHFLSNRIIIRSIIKLLLNRLYRICKNKKVEKKDTVIRAWVDVSEKIYRDNFSSSTIYIYPFTLNVKRGYRFICRCRKEYADNVSLMGVPYQLKYIIKACKELDVGITKFECCAFEKHAKDFYAFSHILTTDDPEVASIAMYCKLISINKTVTNTAHGIGFYSPYVYYSCFGIISQRQKEFYEQNNPNIKYYYRDDFKISRKSKPHNRTFKPVLTILDQGDYAKFVLTYEKELLARIYDFICESYSRLGIAIKIKLHPNRKESDWKKIKSQYPYIEKVNDIKEFIEYDPIFINLLSTSYFDYRIYGPVIFISDYLFNPRLYFGDEIEVVTMDELNNKIINCTNKDVYDQYFK
jgi:hypothetical protein